MKTSKIKNNCTVIIGVPFTKKVVNTISNVAKIIKVSSNTNHCVALVTFELEHNERTKNTIELLSEQEYEISNLCSLTTLLEAAFVDHNDCEQLYHRISSDDQLFSNLVHKKINVIKFEANELNPKIVRNLMLMAGVLPRYIVNSDTSNLPSKGEPSFVSEYNSKHNDIFLPLKLHVPEYDWHKVTKKIHDFRSPVMYEVCGKDGDVEPKALDLLIAINNHKKYCVDYCVNEYFLQTKSESLLDEAELIKAINDGIKFDVVKHDLRVTMSDDITAVVTWL